MAACGRFNIGVRHQAYTRFLAPTVSRSLPMSKRSDVQRSLIGVGDYFFTVFLKSPV